MGQETGGVDVTRAPGFSKHPDHQVVLSEANQSVRILAGELTLAESRQAIRVDESRHDPVYYVPREDVALDILAEMELTSYCPFKGTARYWSLKEEGQEIAWAYDDPYEEVRRLAGHIAFYTDRTRLIPL